VFEDVAPHLSTGGFKVLLDILASCRAPLRIAELPYRFRPRNAGRSKLNELVVVDFAALLVSKATRDTVSPRFLMFAIVGATGLAVHVLALKFLLAVRLPFETAQVGASYIAMTSNFMLNNVLTYGDQRLRGLRALKGFVSFVAVCSVGTLANVGVAKMIYAQEPNWLLAGVAGAVMAAVFNYAVTSVLTWRKT
jgi:dolichol-phosphate mannosyltransferase